MNPRVNLETSRLNIRPLLPADVCDQYIEGLNDSDVNQFLFDTRFTKQTRQTVEQFVEANLKSSTDILFGLFTKQKNEFIGTLRISKISIIHFSCSLGICIFNKNHWKDGLGTEAVLGVVNYLFKGLGLHYVEAGAYIENKASIAMFQKAGFEMQAEYKNKFRYDNDFMPVVFLGKVNPNFDFRRLKSFEKNTIRQAEKRDLRAIWEIRNHPLNRKHFNQQKVIDWNQHQTWFLEKYFSYKMNRCFVLGNDERKVIGYCRFDFSDATKSYHVSIGVHPDYHNKSFGGQLLQKSLRQMKGEGDIFAEVKKGNIASDHLFKRSGFNMFKEDESKNYYRYAKV